MCKLFNMLTAYLVICYLPIRLCYRGEYIMEDNIKKIDNNVIGQRIRNEREKLKLTREEFAELIDLSPLYVGQLERGERQMSLDTLIKISSCLHISTDYILYGDNTDNNIEKSRIITLLNRCSRGQLLFIENMIKLIISYTNDGKLN